MFLILPPAYPNVLKILIFLFFLFWGLETVRSSLLPPPFPNPPLTLIHIFRWRAASSRPRSYDPEHTTRKWTLRSFLTSSLATGVTLIHVNFEHILFRTPVSFFFLSSCVWLHAVGANTGKSSSYSFAPSPYPGTNPINTFALAHSRLAHFPPYSPRPLLRGDERFSPHFHLRHFSTFWESESCVTNASRIRVPLSRPFVGGAARASLCSRSDVRGFLERRGTLEVPSVTIFIEFTVLIPDLWPRLQICLTWPEEPMVKYCTWEPPLPDSVSGDGLSSSAVVSVLVCSECTGSVTRCVHRQHVDIYIHGTSEFWDEIIHIEDALRFDCVNTHECY